MRVYIASDHAGFELKDKVREYLIKEGYEVQDCGAFEFDKDDDYPDFIAKAAEAVSKDPNSRGIVLGSSGQGEAMVANKYKNIRAAIFYGPVTEDSIAKKQSEELEPFKIVKLSRKHNNSNVLSLGARFLTEDTAMQAIKVWLETPFEEAERHVRRIEKIRQIES